MMIRTLIVSLLSFSAVVTSINVLANEPIQPIKPVKLKNPDMVELGKKLEVGIATYTARIAGYCIGSHRCIYRFFSYRL